MQVDQLADEEIGEIEALVAWASEEFDPRKRPLQRWRTLTRWDSHGAEDAQAAIERIRQLREEAESVRSERPQVRQKAAALQRLTSSSEHAALSHELVQEVEGRIRECEVEYGRLENEYRSARELEEEMLGPLRSRHHELHGEMDELIAREEALAASVSELEDRLGSTTDEIAMLERGLRELKGVIRGLR